MAAYWISSCDVHGPRQIRVIINDINLCDISQWNDSPQGSFNLYMIYYSVYVAVPHKHLCITYVNIYTLYKHTHNRDI